VVWLANQVISEIMCSGPFVRMPALAHAIPSVHDIQVRKFTMLG